MRRDTRWEVKPGLSTMSEAIDVWLIARIRASRANWHLFGTAEWWGVAIYRASAKLTNIVTVDPGLRT